ncbi:hypothetical protein LMH73_016955 [Vibrio splendidus]|nr:hypothetical protein [Vibrio splendidus]MCC4881847.1 hypothetical protein [Vibrio splendidus]
MAKALTVFEITTCWQHNRGRYLVAAHSMADAARLLGCSVYHVKTYHYVLESESAERTLALASPRVVFKRENDKSEYLPRVEKEAQALSPELAELASKLQK